MLCLLMSNYPNDLQTSVYDFPNVVRCVVRHLLYAITLADAIAIAISTAIALPYVLTGHDNYATPLNY